MKHKFEAIWRKKNSALCGTEGKKKMRFFFCSRHIRKINWCFFSKTIIWVLQSQRIEALRVEDLATSFCDEVVFVPRGIIVFFQFIVNSGFGHNLSVVISNLLQWIDRICPVVFPSKLEGFPHNFLGFLLVDFVIVSLDFYFLYCLGYI